MIQFLVSLKRKIPWIWHFIEFINGFIFSLFYTKKLCNNAHKILKQYENESYEYRFLIHNDLQALTELLSNQNQEQFKYFKPHDFDYNTLVRLYNNKSFLMFGVFKEQTLVGYFFLRCFINRKSFTGRIVDENYQGQGIAKRMGKILHYIAWQSGFRVFGTASKENIKSLSSYKSINNFKIIKELENNYIYFEYLQSEERPIN